MSDGHQSKSAGKKPALAQRRASRVRVLIVDDHAVLRRRLESHDAIDVVGDVANGREAVQLAEDLSPDVVLMDVVGREREVLQLIADQLVISVKTVEAHIMSKLWARNRTDLIRYAIRRGIIGLDPMPRLRAG